MPTPPDAPVALVTGASSGIGLATARALAGAGYRVFGTSRNPVGDTADGVRMLPLEVTSDESAAACVEAVARETGGRVDVLVNNVGTGILGAAEESSAAQIRALFEVNFFGAVRMTNAVLPLMRARRSGRIVVLSSTGGISSIPFAGYYCATKHALEAYVEALRPEVAPFHIHAVLIAPGPVSTPAGESAMRPDRPIADYAADRDRATADFIHAIQRGMPPAKVAAAILSVLRSERPKPRYDVGGASRLTSLLKRVLPARLFERGVRAATGR